MQIPNLDGCSPVIINIGNRIWSFRRWYCIAENNSELKKSYTGGGSATVGHKDDVTIKS